MQIFKKQYGLYKHNLHTKFHKHVNCFKKFKELYMYEASWHNWYAYDWYSICAQFRTQLNTSYHEIFCGFLQKKKPIF